MQTSPPSLTSKQRKQEDAYRLPYHWMIADPFTRKGRLYFGYIDHCVSFARELPEGSAILDAGCGDGRLLGRLSETLPGRRLCGVDYSERAISFARLFVPEADSRVARLSDLPWPNETFDDVYLVETLEHIVPAEIPGILSELRRVLKRGGRLIITVPSILMGEPSPESKHYQHFTPESLGRTLSAHFSVDSIRGQWRDGAHPLKVLYRVIDNSFVDFVGVRRWFNRVIWPRHLNLCDAAKGKRLIAVCTKK